MRTWVGITRYSQGFCEIVDKMENSPEDGGGVSFKAIPDEPEKFKEHINESGELWVSSFEFNQRFMNK